MYTSFLLVNVIIIINLFCLQNVLGRYILVKMDQQAVPFSRSEKGNIDDFITLNFKYVSSTISLLIIIVLNFVKGRQWIQFWSL